MFDNIIHILKKMVDGFECKIRVVRPESYTVALSENFQNILLIFDAFNNEIFRNKIDFIDKHVRKLIDFFVIFTTWLLSGPRCCTHEK